MTEWREKRYWVDAGGSLSVFVFLVFSMFSILWMGAVACSRAEQVEKTRETLSASEELMTCLALVRAHHRQADMYLKMGDVESAAQAVARIPDVSCPEDASEASGAMLDAHARLSELYVRLGKIDEALRTARVGLEDYKEESFFRAHLLMTYGDVLDVKAKDLEAQGDKKGADELRRLAIEKFSESIEINRRLQKELLEQL